MLISAEIRWFWRDAQTDLLREWFFQTETHPVRPGGGQVRIDYYLWDPTQIELGIKRRGDKKGVEVKGLVMQAPGSIKAGPFGGPIEIWSKWTSERLKLDGTSTVTIRKRRWLRKFDNTSRQPREIALDHRERPLKSGSLPAEGCNVELTKIHLTNGDEWWTLGLEAFGTIQTVQRNLRSAAITLTQRQPPPSSQGIIASYPLWLSRTLGGARSCR